MREAGRIKRAPRIDVQYEGTITDAQGREIPVSVKDVSRDGCRVTGDRLPLIGTYVHLRCGRLGDFDAQVRWSVCGEAGLSLITPVRTVR